MRERDAETGDEILNPNIFIRDFHHGHEMQINLATFSAISSHIIDASKRTIDPSPLYEISTSFGRVILGYVHADVLMANLPNAYQKFVFMKKEQLETEKLKQQGYIPAGIHSLEFLEDSGFGNDIY